MRFGVVPLALQFAVSVASWMVKSRIGAAAAAQQAAAEFEYFKRVSDSELTTISFEMAKQFPQYPYWEWKRILQDLRDYGMFQPGPEPVEPQPPNGFPEDKKPEKKTDYTWLLVGGGVLLLFMMSEG